ncbi:MAG: methyltransferase domain-containing protein [Acidobacteriota bacterium]|nr:methyltransferase domain-containing protein [Acidobacteriota bacterium]
MSTEAVKEVERKVRDHFDEDAERFDSIYKTEKGIFARFIDDYWRGVVQKRLEINIEKLEPLAGKSVLDVGCGSGRFCLAYAKHGATRVLGVDFAPAMIDIANQLAKETGVDKECEFRVGAFPDAVKDTDLPFDASTANGFFDYIEEPTEIITKMREMTRGKVIMSFPKAVEFRVPLRRLRFWMKGTPLFLYSEEQVKKILAAAGIDKYEWINLDRDYLVVADV